MARIIVDDYDQALVDKVVAAIGEAFRNAHRPVAVAKKIVVAAVRFRNKGRDTAIRRHPFAGKCEASGAVLDPRDAVLDELEPEKGYDGRVRWICPKANNSGRRSCGRC